MWRKHRFTVPGEQGTGFPGRPSRRWRVVSSARRCRKPAAWRRRGQHGGYITLGESFLGVYPPRLFVTAHVHLLLVGFMLMIVMGVATWMFPRPARDDTRYRPELAEAVYWVMTVATAVRAGAEVGAGLTGASALRAFITLAGLAQLAGTALFVLNMWWRVRMPAPVPPPSR